jgi:putative sigma-54 modulation protein
MKVAFTFKNVEQHVLVKEHAEDKAEKIKKYVQHPIDMHFFVTQENAEVSTEITLLADHGRYSAKAIEAEALTSVDQAMHKLEAQLRKHKDKVRAHR